MIRRFRKQQDILSTPMPPAIPEFQMDERKDGWIVEALWDEASSFKKDLANRDPVDDVTLSMRAPMWWTCVY